MVVVYSVVTARGSAAFEAFVNDASPGLLRLAYRLTGDRHLAEDRGRRNGIEVVTRVDLT